MKQEPRSGFVGYRQGDVTRKERLLSDQDSVQGELSAFDDVHFIINPLPHIYM